MKKKITLIIFSLTVLFFLFYNDELYKLFNSKIINEMQDGRIVDLHIVLFFFNLIIFLTPFPITIIYILNGFFFGNIGILVSTFCIVFDSLIIYFFSKKYLKSTSLNFRLFKKLIKYQKVFEDNKENYLFFLRFVIPHFFHNILCGFSNLNLKKFFIIVLLAELPGIYAVNMIGKSLIYLKDFKKTNFIEMIYDKNFIIPLLVIFLIFIVYKIINKKIN
tara:strand:- start:884 stop:1540 length:657 start_codon:yes stop_codon:yes gene_type:complete